MSPARVLIVDDERQNRQLLEVILAREGFVLLTAGSGEEALAAVAQQPPDLILLDIMMPGMDGYEVARKLKGDLATKNIPIILITALDDRNARMLALSCGAEDFLTKPVDRVELCARVRNALAKFEDISLVSGDLEHRTRALEAELQRRKGLETSLREREEEFADFFENAVEGLHQLGPDGIILWANKAETALLGYARYEYIGHHISEFHADEEVIKDILTRLAAGETLQDYEARLRCKDGTIKHVLIHANVLRRDGKFVHGRCFTRDITDRKQAEEALRAKKDELDATVRQLNAILQQMPSAVVVVEAASGKLVLSNDKNAAIFRRPTVPLGDSLVGLRDDGREIEPHEWPLSRSITTGEVVTGEEAQIIRGDGTHGWIRINSSPIRAEDGATVGGVVTYEDVTKEVLAKRKLESILQELENASLLKDDFLATISHELRTPLNAILGWIRMLRSDTLPPEKRDRALEIIERNANAQTVLIEDLLDISRIISGKLRLDVGAVDLPGVVENAIDTVRPAADAKNVTLHQTIDPRAGPILGDADRLQQVVWNLLTNAVKFTPANGAVRIAVRKRDSLIEIIVADNGQGIESDFLPKVFERFRQADAAPTRKHGGLGLGLAIMRQLVELHGGTVKVESDGLGKGATFTVCLPISPLRSTSLERPPALRLASGPEFQRPQELEGVRVLLVDDEPDARELLAEVLTSCKASVVIAGSVEEAIRLVKEHRPDVVVSDIGMPVEDGYALIRRLRALPASEGGKTPAVALTAYARSEDRTKALMAGFSMHVPKPVEPMELLAVLANLTKLLTREPD
jgi:PAS domain S-box-containing protein